MYFASSKQMARLDALAVKNGLEIRQMMELAGFAMLGLFKKLRISKRKRIAIVIGKGNKGGDGLACARHLTNYGYKVSLVLLSRNISKDATHHLKLARAMKIPSVNFGKNHQAVLASSSVIIDALIGYNLQGAPRGVFADAIYEIGRTNSTIISYDLPSGVNPDTGARLNPSVKANFTLSLAMPKRLFKTKTGARASGEVWLADIGIPNFLYDLIKKDSRPRFSQGGGLIQSS